MRPDAKALKTPARPRTEAAALPPPPQRRCILLAEADPISREVIRRLLDLIGHEVLPYGDAEPALQRWRDGGVDLVLLDLQGLAPHGPRLLRRLRAAEALQARPRTPVVALTGRVAAQEPAQRPAPAFALGMAPDVDDVLARPVRVEALQQMLARRLPPAIAPDRDRDLAASARRARPAGELRATTPAASAATRPALVDLDVLHRLVGTDPAVVREILLDYLDSAREQALHLRQAYRAADVREVGALVHKLNSASLAVGALALAELCAEMAVPAASDFETAELESVRFERVFTATLAQIETQLAKMPR